MTKFIVNYHIYKDGVKTNKSKNVSFKWYEFITSSRVLKRFFEGLDEEYPVFCSDIDSINLIL